MKRKLKLIIIAISFVFIVFLGLGNSVSVYADNTVYLGGMPAGFSLYSKGAFVVGVSNVLTDDGMCSPSEISDIRKGDVILSIDGIEVNTSKDIENAILNKDKVIMILVRNGEKIIKEVCPIEDVNGKSRLGVFIKDKINGIGTITYIKDGKFASLGHPVLDDCGNLFSFREGEIFSCMISGVIKGERGVPGELRGIFLRTMPYGFINKNLENGVYGVINDKNPYDYSLLKKIEIGVAKMGFAKIYTTVEGETPSAYDISIIKVDPINRGTKNFVIRIDDEILLSKTGGIVQGMSGSPIVQDGKLVGAVTHVFVNDPTRGYGIDIRNMFEN